MVYFLLICYPLLALAFLQLPDDKMHVHFLDIGQGDSVFVKTPENHQILIDGGPGNKVLEGLNEVMPFFDKSIDMIVLTHPHSDHVDGLVEVIKRYEVKMVLLTGVEYKSAAYDEFLKGILAKDIEVFVACRASDFSFGKVKMDTVYPFEQKIAKFIDNANNSSIALKFSYKDASLFLTGDLEKEGETILLKAGLDLKADLLKAGHHGSKTSSIMPFLQKVKPDIVVIQSGKNNSYGHPNKEALDNFVKAGVKKVYRNDLDGKIEFIY